MRAIHTEPEEAVISKALRGLGYEAQTGKILVTRILVTTDGSRGSSAR